MRILVIEDEPGIANFIKQGLEEESFTVDIEFDGLSGLETALTNQYDLLTVLFVKAISLVLSLYYTCLNVNYSVYKLFK